MTSLESHWYNLAYCWLYVLALCPEYQYPLSEDPFDILDSKKSSHGLENLHIICDMKKLVWIQPLDHVLKHEPPKA